MKYCVLFLLLCLGLVEANKKLLGDMDQVVLGEICSGGSPNGKCQRHNTYNFNPETRKCDKVKLNDGECGFFLIKKKCKEYCRAVDPFNLKKRAPMKSDYD